MRRLRCTLGLVMATALSAAAQDFNTDVHTIPSPEAASRAAVNKALEASDWEHALALLGPLVDAHPADALLLYDEGLAEDALNRSAPAEQHFRAAIAANGAVAEPRVELGLLLAREGKREDARAQLAEAVGLPGGDANVRATAFRAMAHLDERTRPADARDELLEALKLSPETREDTLLAAELAGAASGGGVESEKEYRRVLEVVPDDPAAAAGLAGLLVREKRGADAEALLKSALAAHPDNRVLLEQLAATSSDEAKPEEARSTLKRLHDADPKNTEVTSLLAELDMQAKDFIAAEPLLATLAAASPQDGTLLDEHADALIHLQRFAEAQALLTAAVANPKLFPTPGALGDAAGHLAFAASENNDPAAALRALAVRATVLPTSAPVLFLAAISYDKLRQTRPAAEAYRQFLAASNGANPDEESQAKRRLQILDRSK